MSMHRSRSGRKAILREAVVVAPHRRWRDRLERLAPGQVVQALEPRLQLAITVNLGTVFLDENMNGTRDADEGPATFRMFIDSNGNGTYDPEYLPDYPSNDREVMVSAIDGAAAAPDVRPGTYVLRLLGSSSNSDRPLNFTTRTFTVTTTSASISNVAFPAVPTYYPQSQWSIKGRFAVDHNRDGIAGTEGVYELYAPTDPIYIDSNDNAQFDAGEPVATVNAVNKFYFFDNLAAGTYTVRLGARPGMPLRPAMPANGVFRATLSTAAPSASTDVTLVPDGQPIGTSSLGGRVFPDRELDGISDAEPTDSPYAPPQPPGVFLDLDDDGQLDDDEPSQQTTGSNGEFAYQFVALPAGAYTVRAYGPASVSPTGYNVVRATLANDERRSDANIATPVQKPTPSTAAVAVTFSGSYGGVVNGGYDATKYLIAYADLDADGVRDAGEPWMSRRASVPEPLVVSGIPVTPGTTRSVRIGVEGSVIFRVTGVGGSTSGVVTLSPGVVTEVVATITNAVPSRGSIVVPAFKDANRNGIWDRPDATQPSYGVAEVAVTDHSTYLDLNHNGVRNPGEPTSSNIGGITAFDDLAPGTYDLRLFMQSWWELTTGTTLRQVTVVADQTVEVAPFALASPGLPPEPGGFVVVQPFVDVDRDGRFRDGVDVNGGFAQTQFYLDANKNGVRDASEALTSSYEFQNLPVGTHHIRMVPGAGLVQSYPAANGPVVVTVTATNGPQIARFGLYDNWKTIAGVVWDDADRDGVFDANEVAAASRTIYIDKNNNGVFERDLGETWQLTTDAGRFSFDGLAPGTYVVRQYVPAGFQQSYPLSNGGATYVIPTTPPAASGLEATALASFGVTRADRGSIRGTAFVDRNGNGALDAGEPALVGARVYVDADNDGKFDQSETQSIVRADGTYSLDRLGIGAQRVRIESPGSDWTQTLPASSAARTVTLAWGQTSTGHAFAMRRVAAPRALRIEHDVNGASSSLVRVAFNDNVAASLSPGDLSITRVGSAAVSATSVQFDPITRLATFAVPVSLADGSYVASLVPSGVADPFGHAIASSPSASFHVLPGDATRDRVVNFDDLLVLASNYNTTGRSFRQGDFNYDGNVNFDDLLLLASRYNASVAAGGLLRVAPPPVPGSASGDDGDEGDLDGSVLD